MKIRANGSGDEPKTLISRFGFQDGDLKTPQHDEMMLWLDEHLTEVVAGVLGVEMTLAPATVRQMEQAREREISRFVQKGYGEVYPDDITRDWERLLTTPPMVGYRLGDPTWEVPIRSGTYTVGFIDMVVRWDASTRPWFYRGNDPQTGRPRVEWGGLDQDGRVCFEVKSSIPSLGELIRQVRMYQPHLSGDYVVVCADDRFAGPLKRQGIGFARYTP